MKTIGICGKIGCGKSTVGVLLSDRGIPVIDLDMEMHRLYAKSQNLQAKIAERFGADCVRNGTVDRAALAKKVFSDLRSLGDLEQIVYPLLRESLENRLQELSTENSLAAVEGALLFKWPDFSRSLAEIWIVEAPDEVRLARLIARGLSREDAVRRMQIQAKDPLPPNERYRRLDNSGSLTELSLRIGQLVDSKK